MQFAMHTELAPSEALYLGMHHVAMPMNAVNLTHSQPRVPKAVTAAGAVVHWLPLAPFLPCMKAAASLIGPLHMQSTAPVHASASGAIVGPSLY